MTGDVLLAHRADVFSQNGEDGVIDRLFQILGISCGICCEFGAWDGVHFSNTRRLILSGWTGIMIEPDEDKYQRLRETYRGVARVHCLNECVEPEGNTLAAIFARHRLGGLAAQMDLLSIDIDGLDYEIFRGLDLRPSVICVEVNAGHSPFDERMITREIAARNVGQPLAVFSRTAEEMGYGLICYTGNAFYVRRDVLRAGGLFSLTDGEAYIDFLHGLSIRQREWLWLVNRGVAPPYYAFGNPLLARAPLGITRTRAAMLVLEGGVRFSPVTRIVTSLPQLAKRFAETVRRETG